MDLAVLGIKIENGDVVKATASLNSLEVAGTKADIATSRLTRRMALAEIAARDMDAAMTKTSRTTQLLAGAFGAFSAVAVAGFIGKKTIEETIQAQSAMAQLEAAVRSTGGVAGKTVAELDALSVSLQKQTIYSDEAVKGAEAILLTFSKIRGAEFDRATQAVTDLAARMGGDLQGAAVRVGKALQDPATGLAALRKSGVSFSESQITVIKSLYDTGQVAEGQRVILQELEHQFGGSAAAARDTLGGALKGLENAFGDLFEVTRGGSQGTVTGLNAITKSLEDSGLSMNAFVTNTVIGWNNIVAAMQKANNFLSIDITKGLGAELERVRKLNERIDFDRNTEEARLRSPGNVGPAGNSAAPINEETEAARKQHEANLDLMRDAQQAADLAGLDTAAQERARIAYEASNKAIEARRRLLDQAHPLTEAQLAETLQAIQAEERYKLLGADRADALKREKDAIQKAKQDLDQFEDDLSSKLSKSLSRVFGPENPLRGLFESLTKDLLRLWITKFVEPAAAAMFSLDLTNFGRSGMLGSSATPGVGGIADASVSLYPSARYGGAAAGLAGLGVGYGVGGSLYSSARGGGANGVVGALGGGLSGAASGALIGSVIPGLGTAVGAIIGGATGVIGGLLGMGSASKAAAKAMADAVKEVTLSMQSLRATVSGNSLEVDIAAIEEDRTQRVKAVEEAWSGGGAGSDRVLWRTRQEQEVNALEDERIAKLKQEYALSQQYAQEDLEVRKLRAEGLTKEADALARQQAADREIAQAIADHRSDEYIATLRYVTGLELASAAMDKASTSALNMVEGYKLQAEVYRVMASGPQTTSMASYGGASYTGPIRAPVGAAKGTPQSTDPAVLQPVQFVVDGRVFAEGMLKQYGAGQTGGNLKVAFGDLVQKVMPA